MWSGRSNRRSARSGVGTSFNARLREAVCTFSIYGGSEDVDMNRNIRVEGLASRSDEDGMVGSVLSAPVGDGCVIADTVEQTVRFSMGQTIVRIQFDADGIAKVAVDDDVVWNQD